MPAIKLNITSRSLLTPCLFCVYKSLTTHASSVNIYHPALSLTETDRQTNSSIRPVLSAYRQAKRYTSANRQEYWPEAPEPNKEKNRSVVPIPQMKQFSGIIGVNKNSNLCIYHHSPTHCHNSPRSTKQKHSNGNYFFHYFQF